MNRPLHPGCALAACFLVLQIPAQSSGNVGGTRSAADPGFPLLAHEAAERYIVVDGSAELRVRPDALRIVFAVTTESVDPRACHAENQQRCTAFEGALGKLGLKPEAITRDLIAMLPVYDWTTVKQEGRTVATEKVVGHRLQCNVHVMVASEAQAQQAIAGAFEAGITEVIAVDHWCKDLDQQRRRAQELALQEAKRKAEFLLAVFAQRPVPINVQEQTSVVHPRDLYRSFENVNAAQQAFPWREEVARVYAFKPKNTFYEGFFRDLDVTDPKLPMQPELSVVSKVRLYYASPARKDEKSAGAATADPQKK